MMPVGVRDQYARAWATSCYHILLEGPVCRTKFLGKRFVHHIIGVPNPVVLMAPPESMRSADVLFVEEGIQFMVGLDADSF